MMRRNTQQYLTKFLIAALFVSFTFSSPLPAFAKSSDKKSILIKLKNKLTRKAPPKKEGVLVAHWGFDEGAGQIVRDDTAIPQNGTIVKATWEKTPNGCPLGNCLSFNGTNSYVQISGKPKFKTDGLSVSAWVYSDNFCKVNNCQAVIVEKSRLFKSEDDDYFSLETVKVGDGVYPRFHIRVRGKTVTVMGNANINGKLTDGLWSHLTAVYDGKAVTLYKNGLNIGSVNASGSLNNHGPGVLRIGAAADNPVNSVFFGKIDDVRVYREAILQPEIDYLVDQTDLDLFCGDEIVNDDEQCDSDTPVDCSVNGYKGKKECSDECAFESCVVTESCGDKIVQSSAGETCDDGNSVDGDGCSTKCVKEFCGDKIIQPNLGENCDDGNSLNDDGCSAKCVKEYCGDKTVQPGLYEECDGNSIVSCSTWEYQGVKECNSNCMFTECHLLESCGDGKVQSTAGETCDDGNVDDGDGCSAKCIEETCGDGIVHEGLGEECDDMNKVANDGCSNECKLGFCGDNLKQADEFCDGNKESCVTADGYAGFKQCSVSCAAFGNCTTSLFCGDNICSRPTENTQNCAMDCPHICGDSLREGPEECDDGNLMGNDGCSPVCHLEYCNDGQIQSSLSEECEGGSTSSNDLCNSSCKEKSCNVNQTLFTPVQLSQGAICDNSFAISPNGVVAWKGVNMSNPTVCSLILNKGNGPELLLSNSTNKFLDTVNNKGWATWDDNLARQNDVFFYSYNAMTFTIGTAFPRASPPQSGRVNNTDVRIRLDQYHQAAWTARSPSVSEYSLDIIIYDFNTGTQERLTDNNYPDDQLQNNSFNHLAWRGAVDNADGEIFYYNGTNVIHVTENAVEDSLPVINNNDWIVWQGFDGNDTEIYLYHNGQTTAITNNDYDDKEPSINDRNEIIWVGAVSNINPTNGNNEEIFMYDQGFIRRLTTNTTRDMNPSINQNGIVAWVGHPNQTVAANQELYLYVQGNTYRLTNDAVADSMPKLGLNHLFWLKGEAPDDQQLFKVDLPLICN